VNDPPERRIIVLIRDMLSAEFHDAAPRGRKNEAVERRPTRWGLRECAGRNGKAQHQQEKAKKLLLLVYAHGARDDDRMVV